MRLKTDTGGFTYNSNSREIYFIISELLSKGIDKLWDGNFRQEILGYSLMTALGIKADEIKP